MNLLPLTGRALTLCSAFLLPLATALGGSPHRSVPFNALFQSSYSNPGYCTEDPTPDDGNALVTDVSGSGLALHLGNSTLQTSHCFDFTTLAIHDGILAITASGGDQLFGAYEAQLIPTSQESSILVGEFIITGGTGRFLNAQGHGAAYGTSSFTSSESTFMLDGTLLFPKTNPHLQD